MRAVYTDFCGMLEKIGDNWRSVGISLDEVIKMKKSHEAFMDWALKNLDISSEERLQQILAQSAIHALINDKKRWKSHQAIEMTASSVTGAVLSSPTLLSTLPLGKYLEKFSRKDAWKRTRSFTLSMGPLGTFEAAQLYYVLKKADVPLEVKATLIGALGHFISPLDLVPEAACSHRHVEDLAVLNYALFAARPYLDSDIKLQSHELVSKLFGPEEADYLG